MLICKISIENVSILGRLFKINALVSDFYWELINSELYGWLSKINALRTPESMILNKILIDNASTLRLATIIAFQSEV